MTAPGWLTSSTADVPPGDDWLSRASARCSPACGCPSGAPDWRLGRWTAKAAVAAWLGVGAERVEILAAADGAPEAWLDGAPAPVSLSLSHRAGGRWPRSRTRRRRSAATSSWSSRAAGRSYANGSPRASRPRSSRSTARRDVAANLIWTAKEAAAKVRREGLRLDVRRADVDLGAPGSGWRPLTVHWGEGQATAGWWCAAGGWVMTIAGSPAPALPSRLAAGVR